MTIRLVFRYENAHGAMIYRYRSDPEGAPCHCGGPLIMAGQQTISLRIAEWYSAHTIHAARDARRLKMRPPTVSNH